MSKELWCQAFDELMIELYPEREYWELSEEELDRVSKLASEGAGEKFAAMIDGMKERRKYEGL